MFACGCEMRTCTVLFFRHAASRGSSHAYTDSARIFAGSTSNRSSSSPAGVGGAPQQWPAFLKRARNDHDLARASEVLDLQERHALPGRAPPGNEGANVTHRAAHVHEQTVKVGAEFAHAGVDALLQIVRDPPQRVIAEVDPQVFALPAQPLFR